MPAIRRGKAKQVPKVVAIGSSAGGLEALRGLLAPLPPGLAMSFVVAQHLSPDHHSMLGDLLRRETPLEVEIASDGREIDPGHVYVTPPNRNISVSGGRIHLEAAAPRGVKPSADRLFESIALEYGESSIGVVLSGTGSDAARGVAAVRGAGGLVFAQDPGESGHPGMPENAIATHCVDAVLPVREIAQRLIRLAEAGSGAGGADVGSKFLDRTLARVGEESGIDFSGYKARTLSRRLAQRMVAIGVADPAAYENLLLRDPGEARHLAQSWLISVTEFFRDRAPFAVLRNRLQQARKQIKGTFRAWVPACATGEEAYSLAYLLHEAAPEVPFQIFATDIDERALAIARGAVYPEAKLETMPSDLESGFFVATARGLQVSKSLRDRVVFSRHDVMRDPPFLSLDLISCRNLLIYLRPQAQEQLFHRFNAVMNSGGLLFLGRSETAPDAEFLTVDAKSKLYMTRGGAAGKRRLLGFSLARPRETPVERAATGEPGIGQAVLEALAPTAVVTNLGGTIRETTGAIDRYLTLKPGRVDHSLPGLVPKPVAPILRALMQRCDKGGRPVEGLARTVEIQGETVELSVSVHPAGERDNEKAFLVIFREAPVTNRQESVAAENGEAVQMQAELNALRENLQTVVSDLETSNEELQALNEELQATNQEMQATNEELQAANEELHSTNEELVTLNDELQHKSVELAASLADLHGIEDSLGDPLIVLSRDGGLQIANELARTMFGLTADDFGRPLLLRGEARLASRIAAQVDRSSRTQTRGELRAVVHDRSYSILVRPYYSAEGHERGTVLLFRDVTDLVAANAQLLRAKRASEASTGAGASSPGPNSQAEVCNACGVGALHPDRCSAGQRPAAVQIAGCAEGDPWYRCQDFPATEEAEIEALIRGASDLRGGVSEPRFVNPTCITDPEGRLLWMNKRFEDLTGTAAVEQWLSQPEHVNRSRFSALVRHAVEHRLVWHGEVQANTPDGATRALIQTITPVVSSEGETKYAVCVHRDAENERAGDWEAGRPPGWSYQEILDELRRCVDAGLVSLAFEPGWDTATGRILGAEIVPRFESKVITNMPRDRWTRTDEASELIAASRQNIVEEAVEHLARWVTAGHRVALSIGIQVWKLRDGRRVRSLAEILSRHGVPPGLLHLAVGEGMFLDRSPEMRQGIGLVKELGMPLVLDHFGTGILPIETVLAATKGADAVPLRAVRIAASAIRQIGVDHSVEAAIRATIESCRRHGLGTVAMGVDTKTQETFLAEAGCNAAHAGLTPLSAGHLEGLLIRSKGNFIAAGV